MLMLKCSLQFMFGFDAEIVDLNRATDFSSIPYIECKAIIEASPLWQGRAIQEEAAKSNFADIRSQAPTRADANKLIYNMFFDSIHNKGVVQALLARHYSSRWFSGTECRPAPGIQASISATWALEMGRVGCKHIRFLGQCLPSRAHLANIRFQFNGWHTQARYQKRHASKCLFCQRDDSEDSIEHIVQCPVVQRCLSGTFKRGSPPRTPTYFFFLFGLGNKHKLAMGLFIFALLHAQ